MPGCTFSWVCHFWVFFVVAVLSAVWYLTEISLTSDTFSFKIRDSAWIPCYGISTDYKGIFAHVNMTSVHLCLITHPHRTEVCLSKVKFNCKRQVWCNSVAKNNFNFKLRKFKLLLMQLFKLYNSNSNSNSNINDLNSSGTIFIHVHHFTFTYIHIDTYMCKYVFAHISV